MTNSRLQAGVPLPADRELDGRDIMPLLLETDKTSPHDCIFYWKGCTDPLLCGVPDESPLVNKKNPGLWAVRYGPPFRPLFVRLMRLNPFFFSGKGVGLLQCAS